MLVVALLYFGQSSRKESNNGKKKNNKSILSVRIALKKNNATVSGAAYELRAGNYDSEVLTV